MPWRHGSGVERLLSVGFVLGCGPAAHEKAALSARGGQAATFYSSCCGSMLPMSDVRQNLLSGMDVGGAWSVSTAQLNREEG